MRNILQKTRRLFGFTPGVTPYEGLYTGRLPVRNGYLFQALLYKRVGFHQLKCMKG